jgi:CRISPR-associated exonuclease Cas4
MYAEDDYLMLSGLQHFAYCRRQWALIHIEQQWAENERTTDGHIFHKRAHDADQIEKRGDLLITRGLRVKSAELGISGICDVVEFRKSDDGITLHSFEGKWRPYPVEYKKGEPKPFNADELQLCAQAMCLEEMLSCHIGEGSLYYGETRRRTKVQFSEELRQQVKDATEEMHEMFERGYTPRVKPQKGCNACSLRDICVPKLSHTKSVSSYIENSIGES